MGSEAVVLSEVRGRVGVLTLNRPERMNAWTAEMQTALFDGLDAHMRADALVPGLRTGEFLSPQEVRLPSNLEIQ